MRKIQQSTATMPKNNVFDSDTQPIPNEILTTVPCQPDIYHPNPFSNALSNFLLLGSLTVFYDPYPLYFSHRTQTDKCCSLPTVCNTHKFRAQNPRPLRVLNLLRKFKPTLIHPIRKLSAAGPVKFHLPAYLIILLSDISSPTNTLNHSLTYFFLISDPTSVVLSVVMSSVASAFPTT